MNRTRQLAQRRAMLVAECALQRHLLQIQSKTVRQACGWDSSSQPDILGRLKHLPVWVGGLLAAVIALVPGKTIAVARNGYFLWQLWRRLSSKNKQQ